MNYVLVLTERGSAKMVFATAPLARIAFNWYADGNMLGGEYPAGAMLYTDGELDNVWLDARWTPDKEGEPLCRS